MFRLLLFHERAILTPLHIVLIFIQRKDTMQNHTKELYENLQTLTIFRPLLTHPLLQQLQTMLHTQLQLAQHPDAPAQLYDAISAYCDFTSEIYEYSVQNESEISGNF